MVAAAMEDRPRTAATMEHRASAVEHGTRTAASEVMTSATVEDVTTSATAEAMKAAASAVETTATAMKTTATVEAASATMEATATMMTEAATHLDGQRIRRGLRHRPSAGTHGRHGRSRPAGRTRKYKQCRRRKTEATNKTSMLVLHPHHGPFSLNAVK